MEYNVKIQSNIGCENKIPNDYLELASDLLIVRLKNRGKLINADAYRQSCLHKMHITYLLIHSGFAIAE